MENPKVEYKCITGNIGDVATPLTKSISSFCTHYSEVKVGITGRKPQYRFNEHLLDYNWERMVVKYATTSKKNANRLEKFFIATKPNLVNKWTGESDLAEKGKKYLYVLLKGKKQN